MNKKIRNLFIALSGLALSVGAAVGVELGADKGVEEAKALSDGYYLCGSFVGWDHSKSISLTQDGTNHNIYFYDGLYLNGHDDYFIQAFSVSGGTESWAYSSAGNPVVNNGIVDYAWDSGDNAGIKFDNNFRYIKIEVDISSKIYTFSASSIVPTVKIGNGAAQNMSFDSTEKNTLRILLVLKLMTLLL